MRKSVSGSDVEASQCLSPRRKPDPAPQTTGAQRETPRGSMPAAGASGSGDREHVTVGIEGVPDVLAPRSRRDRLQQLTTSRNRTSEERVGVRPPQVELASLTLTRHDCGQELKNVLHRHEAERGPTQIELGHARDIKGWWGTEHLRVELSSPVLVVDVEDQLTRVHEFILQRT